MCDILRHTTLFVIILFNSVLLIVILRHQHFVQQNPFYVFNLNITVNLPIIKLKVKNIFLTKT